MSFTLRYTLNSDCTYRIWIKAKATDNAAALVEKLGKALTAES